MGILWGIAAISSPFIHICHLSSLPAPEICCRAGSLSDTKLTKPSPQAEQSKVLSAVEDRMDELGASIAQSRRTVALIKVRAHSSPPVRPEAGL